MDAGRTVGRDSHHNAGVGIGGEIFGGIMIAVALIAGVGHRLANVEAASVVAHFPRVGKGNLELTQRLIVLGEMTLHIFLQLVSFFIVSLP